MKKILIKICGLTRVEDVQAATAAGADVIGFVFTTSPRQISIDKAIELCSYVPEGVLRVGLFLGQSRSEVEHVIRSVPLDVLQFHGDETEQFCSVFNMPWLKAVAMEDDGSVRKAEREFPGAMGLLLDSHVKGEQGGSGKQFDWSLSNPVAKPVWLAGGLNANNVKRAIQTVRPYAVDVSSGVESEPGIKNAAMMKAFVKAVREAENKLEMVKSNE